MSEPPWWQQCLDNIAKIPGAKLCPQDQCSQVAPYLDKVCNCRPPYQNGCASDPSPGCCSYDASSPIVVFFSSGYCYCCCGAVGASPAVATGEGQSKPLAEVLVGDWVQAALDPDLKSWALVAAEFSSGAGEGGPAIAIRLGQTDLPETIFVARDQLFLVAGRLKRASRLARGDQLTRHDGSSVEILDIAEAVQSAPQHRIATSNAPAADLAGHLIIIDDLVVGDYALQIADLEAVNPAILVEGHADLPELGSPEYAARYGHSGGGAPQ